MTNQQKITEYGQLSIGDNIVIVDSNGQHIHHVVQDILSPGTNKEEIIIDKKDNKYFVTSKYLNDNSWANEVYKKISKETSPPSIEEIIQFLKNNHCDVAAGVLTKKYITLLPCPFCGGECEITDWHRNSKPLQCKDCNATTPDLTTWNTRK